MCHYEIWILLDIVVTYLNIFCRKLKSNLSAEALVVMPTFTMRSSYCITHKINSKCLPSNAESLRNAHIMKVRMHIPFRYHDIPAMNSYTKLMMRAVSIQSARRGHILLTTRKWITHPEVMFTLGILYRQVSTWRTEQLVNLSSPEVSEKPARRLSRQELVKVTLFWSRRCCFESFTTTSSV